jgi:DNA-binding response OmpR family regulator
MTIPANRLLVVDDEPDCGANLADIFGDRGYCVDVAYDGEHAIALARLHDYAVALLDFCLPGMNGVELCRELHNISTATRAILLTSYLTPEISDDARSAGAVHSLSKPVEVERLLLLVDQAALRTN